MKRTRTTLLALLAALATTVVAAPPAGAHMAGFGYYCEHRNDLHRALPDVYFIGHAHTPQGHRHVYVHDPLIGGSSTIYRVCG